MQVTSFRWEKADSEGNPTKMITKTYSCGHCGVTVRSEDLEAVEGEDGESEATEQPMRDQEPCTDKKRS
jgi:hypothetical protein